MANNYTVSTHITSEEIGDNPASGTLPSSVELIITPNTGYAVKAADFFIGNTLPSEITSVTFTDTGTPLAASNTVKATATIASWYQMPSSNVTIDIDIDGKAERVATTLHFKNIHSDISNLTETFTLSSGGTTSAATVGSAVTNTCSLPITSNTTAVVCTMRFLATSGYHLYTMPTFNINSNSSNWSSSITNQVYNSDGQLTDITFSFSYSMGTQDVPASLGEQIQFNTFEMQADRVDYKVIETIGYEGFVDEDIIPAKELDLTLNVTGTQESTYNIKIEDSNGLTYNFNTNTFDRSLTFSDEQTIPTNTNQLLNGRQPGLQQHIISFPAFFFGESYDFSFTTTITPTGTTTTSTDGSTTPLTTVLNQFGEPSVTITSSTATTGEVAASTSVKSISNQTPLRTLSTFNPTEFPDLNTTNNGYFTYSQVLSYTATDTTASGFSGTTMTMSTSYVTKKVQVGDTVSHANISDGTRVSAVNVGGDAVVYTLNQAPAVSVPGGQTITFTRNVGISRQPSSSDIRSTSPITSFNGVTSIPSHSVSETVSNQKIIKLEEAPDDLTVGMLVEGENIVGFPTITAITGQHITISKNQNLTIGETLQFSVAGTRLEIKSISVTGSGTASAKLNVEGFVEKVGVADVAIEVVLDNFMSGFVTGALTAVATTASCSLGGSVIITPLDVNSSSTGELTIASVPSSGSGTTSLSNDGQSIKYKAPTSGTSDTITYTINDGVSTSAAADIVITLTP